MSGQDASLPGERVDGRFHGACAVGEVIKRMALHAGLVKMDFRGFVEPGRRQRDTLRPAGIGKFRKAH